MISINSITAKNFLSIGNITQALEFNKDQLTLIIGENLDLGGEENGNKNGVGKTVLINAISYAIYGQALNSIKRENLINKTNGKNMLVTIDFSIDNIKYKIERGRKPNLLKFYINSVEQKVDSTLEDDSQGDSRETQKHIESLFNMSHTMFKHLVALNTYTEPFLAMKAADQRDVIEQLLGMTLLSEKSEVLKVEIKNTKDLILAETIKIEATKASNENILKSISNLELKSKAWDKSHELDVIKLSESIDNLSHIDIDQEIELHLAWKKYKQSYTLYTSLLNQKNGVDKSLIQNEKLVSKYSTDLETLMSRKCPTCHQDLHDDSHLNTLNSLEKSLRDSIIHSEELRTNSINVKNQIDLIGTLIEPKSKTHYKSESEARNHKSNLDSLEQLLIAKMKEQNQYVDQIEDLKKTALVELDWTKVNEYSKLKDHQEFLLKLLTNKDSFIRKNIIEQNLNYLNKRLDHYTTSIGLPHQVIFLNDLSVEITQLGQSLDFDNLSRGERNRLILSMSFAFRDVWENLYHHINLLFVDELLDSGMDTAGIESGLSILKKMARERNKNVFLISHKDELIGRVNSILKVVKENGFTTYEHSADLATV